MASRPPLPYNPIKLTASAASHHLAGVPKARGEALEVLPPSLTGPPYGYR